MDDDYPVYKPFHYTQGGIECIDAMVEAFGAIKLLYIVSSMPLSISGEQTLKGIRDMILKKLFGTYNLL